MAELMMGTQLLLRKFREDPNCEGDVNDFGTDFVCEALRHKLIKICSCERNYRNARLTQKGLWEARSYAPYKGVQNG